MNDLMEVQVGDVVVSNERYTDYLMVHMVVRSTKCKAQLQDGREFWKSTGNFVRSSLSGSFDGRFQVMSLTDELQKEVDQSQARRSEAQLRSEATGKVSQHLPMIERALYGGILYTEDMQLLASVLEHINARLSLRQRRK
jgi:hypothetical protein